MTKIALLGAGGKMGVRLATNLKGSRFTVDHVEVSAEGRQRLKDAIGADCVSEDAALAEAEVIVLAVPDRLIGKIAHSIIARVKPGSALIVLDAAAPYAGEMPERADVSYFVTHPCHPSVFPQNVKDGERDHFGGVSDPQAIVCALIQGPEAHYALCEEVARTIYAPVNRAHRCTLENIAVMEPAMSETVGATLCLALREATDEAVRRGVPEAAAMDFMLGHIQIELAIAFNIFKEGKFSDGALHAIREARPLIFKENWLQAVFSPEAVMASVKDICNPREAA
ncbi:NAD binding domain of 6-phosphogluconate dehydrogenase [Kaistia soli DSM 19436]|uniref:NAD binding domain of 6-phosphogluconate dehydrogenase n=1 Tax=Kaistia soli DSM 19436 TaxID=1122133 RepID=A0A1M4WR23_9HYPH|nr:phosphogluconate dehydrogenase C-terminal domain-containing protein [Kaistia soli]SHE83513.1 NAD binding domain of 6-phosphogluconate dehydrogenase [Kaistia soli DSM 19436]